MDFFGAQDTARRKTWQLVLLFGAAVVGLIVLTNLLAPALLAGAPARVVNLSSGGHRMSDVLFDDPNFEHTEYEKFVSSTRSKASTEYGSRLR